LFQLITQEINEVLAIELLYQTQYMARLRQLPAPAPGVQASEFMIKISKEEALTNGFTNSSTYTKVLINPTITSTVPQFNDIAKTSIQSTLIDANTYATSIVIENKSSYIQIARAISSTSLQMVGAKPLIQLSNVIVESFTTIKQYNSNINLLPMIQSFTTLKLQTLMNLSKDALDESSDYDVASKRVFESPNPGDDRQRAAYNLGIATNRLVSKTKLIDQFIDEVMTISKQLTDTELSDKLSDAKREITTSIEKAEKSATKVNAALQKIIRSRIVTAFVYKKLFTEINSVYHASMVQVEISIKTLQNAYDKHVLKLTNSESIINEHKCVKSAQVLHEESDKFFTQPNVNNAELVFNAAKIFDDTVKVMVTAQKNDMGKSSKQAIQFAMETVELFLKIAKSKMNYVKDIKVERKFIEKLKLFIDENKKIDKNIDYDVEQKGLEISRAAQNILDSIDIHSKAPQARKEAIESAFQILQQAKMKSLYLLTNAEREFAFLERTVDKSIHKFETSSIALQFIKEFDSQLNEAIVKLSDPKDSVSAAIYVDSAISTITKYNQYLKITQDVYLEVIKYAKLLLDSVNSINKISNIKTNQELMTMVATSTTQVPGNETAANAISAATEATKGTFQEKIIQSIIHSAPDITLDIVQHAIISAIRDSFDNPSSISDDKVKALQAVQKAAPKVGILPRIAGKIGLRGGSAVTDDTSALSATYQHIIADSKHKMEEFDKEDTNITKSRERVIEEIKLRVATAKQSKLVQVSNIKNDDIVKRENQFIKTRDTDIYKILIKTQGMTYGESYNNWASTIDNNQYIKNKLNITLDKINLTQLIYELSILMIMDHKVNGVIHSTIDTFTSRPNSNIDMFVNNLIQLVKEIENYYFSLVFVNGKYVNSPNQRPGINNDDLTSQLQKYANIDGKLEELRPGEDPEVVIRWNTLKYLQTIKTDTTDSTKLSEYYRKIIPQLMKYRCNKSYIELTYPSTCEKRYIEAAFLINIFKKDLVKYKEKNGEISNLSMDQYDAYINKFKQIDRYETPESVDLSIIQHDISNIIKKINHIVNASTIKDYKDDCNEHYIDINSSFEQIADSLGRYSSFLKKKEPISNT